MEFFLVYLNQDFFAFFMYTSKDSTLYLPNKNIPMLLSRKRYRAGFGCE